MRFRLLSALTAVGIGILASCGDDGESADDPAPVLLVLPAERDGVTDRLAAEATRYLALQTGAPPAVLRVAPTDLDAIASLAQVTTAGLAVVLQADRVVPDRMPARDIDALPEDSYRLETEDVGDFPNAVGDRGATVVLAAGHGTLGDQYALYEVLRRLGARFYHPEEELVVRVPTEQIRARARAATAVARRDGEGEPSRDYVPDFAHRSYTFHAAHPLETLESFSDGGFPIDEARRANEWMVKNRADLFRGAGRGVASADAQAQRGAELEALRQELGMRRTTGITLHNEQQGASAQIDPTSSVPVKQQIETLVDAALAETPDAVAFGVHFGPTEFTVTPDEETVQWIEWAGLRARAVRPDVPVWINDHTSGSQPTPHYDDAGCPPGTNGEGRGDYYDLAFHTDVSLGVSVHTVMFYPLEGDARVYNQRTFAHKLCLMQRASAEGRELQWFPEGSWWLSFDNTIPVYLPLYIDTRRRDIRLVQPLLASRGGTLRSHRMFDSGHEWGYWQQDYAVGLWHWNTDVTLAEVYRELTDGFCAPSDWPDGCAAQTEAADVLETVVDHQTDFFLEREDVLGRVGGLYTYFAGEDPADEIAAASNFEFRPVRVAFRQVLGWDDDLVATFRVSDLAALAEAEAVYGAGRARLEAVQGEVPEPGRPFFAEIVDGLAVNELRARHTRHLYEAVLALRAGDSAAAAAARDAAAATLVDVQSVVARREAAYRYPLEQAVGGGLTPETAVENGTTYPYRVQTKTHLLTYWTYRQEQVDALIAGETGDLRRIVVTPVFDVPGVVADLAWPEDAEVAIDVDLGDGTVIDEPVPSHDYGDEEGIYRVEGSIVVDGVTLPIRGGVARALRRAASPLGALTIVEPADEVAQSTVGSLAPAFRLAITDEALALAPEAPPDLDDEPLDFATVAVADIESWSEGGAFATTAEDFTLPIPNGEKGTTLPLRIEAAVFTGVADEDGFAPGPDADVATVRVEGGLVVQDVVDALIELAGFDQAGAEQTLAGVLGFDPNDPPATVPFVADFGLE